MIRERWLGGVRGWWGNGTGGWNVEIPDDTVVEVVFLNVDGL